MKIFWPKAESIRTDIKFAFRQLRKSPGFAITTILTLSLGIAATVAIFGFVDSALIRPLPYPSPSRLMRVFETFPLGGRGGYSYPNYFDLERSNRVFASIAAYDVHERFVLSDAESKRLVHGIGVTSNFFRILGMTPILGSDFVARPDSEDALAAPPTVLLSYAAWRNRFGGRPDVLGKTVSKSRRGRLPAGRPPRMKSSRRKR